MSERVLPHPAPSVWRGWALSLLSSAVANELLRLAATSAFPVTSFEPLTRPAVFLWTAVGATGAAVVFAALRRYAARPAHTFRQVALVVLALSWIPDLLLLASPPPQLSPVPPHAPWILAVLHVPPWLASTWFLTGGVLPRSGEG